MNVVDVVLAVAIFVFAVTGWRRGFIYGLLSLVGFVVGAAMGFWLAPQLVGSWQAGLPKAITALVIVFVLAVAGQMIVGMAGRRIGGVATAGPAGVLNSVGGAVLSVLFVLVVAWFAASLFATNNSSSLARDVRQSQVLDMIDHIVPMDASDVSGQLQSMFSDSGFPEVFSGLGPEPVAAISAPDAAITHQSGVVHAAAETVKVVGSAPSCNETVSGSGFAIAPDRIMTNAHVVAGVRNPEVTVGGSDKAYDATVVYFDPSVDVAILAVPDLPVQPLTFSGNVERDQSIGVIGYPEHSPLTVSPGRVREVQMASGRDIYGQSKVVREIISMRTQVRPGNSGGPVVNHDGKVVGVVFASSLDSAETGYAMTADEVAPAVSAGVSSVDEVGTGPCS